MRVVSSAVSRDSTISVRTTTLAFFVAKSTHQDIYEKIMESEKMTIISFNIKSLRIKFIIACQTVAFFRCKVDF